jgi:hypothetical protein
MIVQKATHDDLLTSIMITSKKFMNETVPGVYPDSKLNYKRICNNPNELQVTYINALDNLK